jgi:hypothetical protein
MPRDMRGQASCASDTAVAIPASTANRRSLGDAVPNTLQTGSPTPSETRYKLVQIVANFKLCHLVTAF